MLIRANLVHESYPGLTCMSPSRTQQQFKDECDVNNILNNYVNTGILSHTSSVEPIFGDFTEVPSDYGEALALIKRSEEAFSALPSDVRERFDSSPANLIAFLQNPANRDEAIKLGFIDKVVDPVKDEVKE